ncbi:alpha/beta hydrolase [Ramlibacter sp. XY19]|uniref:alpha/beta hydrolase n=1 Tax=Ramlibacter paludis TaxID=2908000 RepID=UPI0023DBF8C4|nr:alpha/beta hydrolase [Ramlibacter paludis]MCG2595500.1 alpha/beta hydrolase [Ramlibacter paludis]
MKRLLLALLALLWLTGCSTTNWHLAPTPAVLKEPRLDFERAMPEALRTTRLPVFYATTRARTESPENYSNSSADGVELGVAQVRLGEPGWDWAALMASDQASTVAKPRNGAVESVQAFGTVPQADDAFVQAIDAQLARTKNPTLVFYVHGYRVAFNEVAVQMGSFSHYLGQGAVVTFQWPTGSMFWNYLTDCPRAEQYIPAIERMLALLARTKAEQISVMAYSCGSPLLAAALDRLRARTPAASRDELQKSWRIGNVMYVASDVDLKTFASEHVQPSLDLARQVLVYYSRIDRALGFSSLIAGASRLGRPDITDLSVEEIRRLASDPRLQAIDVTSVRGAHEMGGMKGHGYWYANEVISTDVLLSLRYPIPPAQRCLENQPGTLVWRIPENYVDCVSEKLLRLYPALAR